mmetsp:Transcript_18550/g.30549  ORF Transcript_18550/g.30549 Transcript_18550/m.30549 type:complete len:251 (-) Transcript_18550:2153-2905(-)
MLRSSRHPGCRHGPENQNWRCSDQGRQARPSDIAHPTDWQWTRSREAPSGQRLPRAACQTKWSACGPVPRQNPPRAPYLAIRPLDYSAAVSVGTETGTDGKRAAPSNRAPAGKRPTEACHSIGSSICRAVPRRAAKRGISAPAMLHNRPAAQNSSAVTVRPRASRICPWRDWLALKSWQSASNCKKVRAARRAEKSWATIAVSKLTRAALIRFLNAIWAGVQSPASGRILSQSCCSASKMPRSHAINWPS